MTRNGKKRATMFAGAETIRHASVRMYVSYVCVRVLGEREGVE